VGRQLNVSSSSSGARDAVLCAGCIVCLVCYGGVCATVLLCVCVCVCVSNQVLAGHQPCVGPTQWLLQGRGLHSSVSVCMVFQAV
jgi:hypothetical protein